MSSDPRRPLPLADDPDFLSSLSSPTPGRRPLLDLFPVHEGSASPPFGASHDLRFLYHSAELDRVTQDMLGAIGRHETLLTLSGESGVGKTMLCRALMEQLDRRTLTSFVPGPVSSTAALYRAILTDFGVISGDEAARARLAHATEDELSAVLREFLASLLPLKAFAVMIIDDAENLPAHVLDEIRRDDRSLMQIVLVGADLKMKLKESGLRISLACALGPLAAGEMRGYIGARLRAAGASPRVEFEEPALARMHARSRGVPGVVNLICSRAIEAGFERPAHTIDAALIDQTADELGLERPAEVTASRRSRIAFLVLALGLLLAAGAYAFRDSVQAIVARWIAP